MNQEDLFEKIFGSDESDREPLFDKKDKLLGRFIYNVACEVFQPDQNYSDDESDEDGNDDNADTASVVSFEEKIEATRKNFDRILELFKKTGRAKKSFLKNFDKWAPQCKEQVKILKEVAEVIHSDKFNSDIAKLVGTVVAALGGIAIAFSYFTPLAAVTVPLTIGGGVGCGLGGAVAFGAGVTEIVLLKKKLDEVKRVVQRHEESFSLMAHWFTIPEELKKALESLVDYSVLKEVGEDLKKFFADIERTTEMTIGDFKMQFKEELKRSMKKMNKSGKVTSEFGSVFTPIVMFFIFFFCLLKGKNRILLDCIMLSNNLALSLIALLNLGVPISQLANGMARGAASEFGDDILKLLFSKILVGVTIVIDLISVVLNSIEIHKRPEPEQTKKIKDAAEKLEKMFIAIENVYNATKKYDNEAPKKWTTIVVNSIPADAREEDIRMAVESHLSDKSLDYIKLKRLSTNGNNWQVKVPESDSEQLLQQSDLIIKEQHCFLTK